MPVKRTDYVTVVEGRVSGVDLMDTTQGSQMTRMVPMAVVLNYRIREGRWVFEFASVTGPRILNNGKRGTKNTSVIVHAEYLDTAPQWLRDFVADQNPGLIGAGTMREVTP